MSANIDFWTALAIVVSAYTAIGLAIFTIVRYRGGR